MVEEAVYLAITEYCRMGSVQKRSGYGVTCGEWRDEAADWAV